VTAVERRRGFRHALGCFLDLVAVRLAGGAGVEGALNDSATSGLGWAFGEIRQALAQARLMGEAPWAGLDRLGNDLAISELSELAASVALAGDEGARVRTSISAKARSIRLRGLADAESSAQAASERMSLPIVLLMLGFVIFLGYPAVMQVLMGL
jgi:Flp pilus assembly protein TadB